MKDAAIYIMVGAALFVFALLVAWHAAKAEREWQAFAKTHNCKVVGRQAASTATGIGVNHSGSVSVVAIDVPARVGYACDDGVIYWR